MSQPALVRIYASLWPCAPELAAALEQIAALALPPAACAGLEGDLFTLSFEGIFYPVDDMLAVLKAALSPAQQGRIDVFDLEAWHLTRYTVAGGAITESGAPLNAVLANSVRPEAGA